MRTVEDRAGRRYELLKRSEQASLVRDPSTGERRYLPNDVLAFDVETGPDPRTLIVEAGGMRIRELLDRTSLCESDVHARLADLQVRGLIRETEIDGERGYEPVPADERPPS